MSGVQPTDDNSERSEWTARGAVERATSGDPRTASSAAAATKVPGQVSGASRRGHSLMMLACCVPMLLIAGALVVTGVAGAGVVLAAVLCTVMMAAMMFLMPGNGRHQ